MKNISGLIAAAALLTAMPVVMTALPLAATAQAQQAPQYVASPILASLGVSVPDHNTHSAGCGCASCGQGCQIADPSTV